MQERLLKVEESKAVPHGPAQNPADYVAGLHVGGQLAVGNGKGNGPDMVGDDPDGDVGFFVLSVFYPGMIGNEVHQRPEHVRIVVGANGLDGHVEALKAHARVHVLGGEAEQGAVGQAVKLHEHQVPDLHHLRVIPVHQVPARHPLHLLLRAQVDVDFGAGAAGTGVTHFPEVVFFGAEQDTLIGHNSLPEVQGIVVLRQLVLLIAPEY